jgi:hypothetical protein
MRVSSEFAGENNGRRALYRIRYFAFPPVAFLAFVRMLLRRFLKAA